MKIELHDGWYFDLSDGLNWTLIRPGDRKKGSREGDPDVKKFYGNGGQAWAGAVRECGGGLRRWDGRADLEVAKAMSDAEIPFTTRIKTEKGGFHLDCCRGYYVADLDSMNWAVRYPKGPETYHGTIQSAMKSILWDHFMRKEKTVSWGACEQELVLCAAETIRQVTRVGSLPLRKAPPERVGA